MKQRKDWRMSCDVGKATKRLENELRRFTYVTAHSPTLLSLLLRHRLFTYLTSKAHSPTFPSLHLRQAHSPTIPSLYLRHSPFSNPSVTSLKSQIILQPFFRFPYVTSSSLNSPGEAPMKNMKFTAIFSDL